MCKSSVWIINFLCPIAIVYDLSTVILIILSFNSLTLQEKEATLYLFIKFTTMKKKLKNKAVKLLISLAAPIIIWAISWLATSTGIDSWYLTLTKPVFNPPNWIFGPVWSMLYLMIWYSFYQIWDKFWTLKKIPNKVKGIYALQLFLNFMWSITFFGMQNPWLWLINILVLWVVILINISLFYKIKKSAGLLLVPYIFWVSFASLLNYAIFILN